MSDPMKYRTKEEAEKAKERDPIVLYESLLKERGWIDETALEEMHEKIKARSRRRSSSPSRPRAPARVALRRHHRRPFIPQE